MTDTPHDDEGPLRERIIALEAENARLREALERITQRGTFGPAYRWTWPDPQGSHFNLEAP